MNVAVTGGLGTGKSTVSRILTVALEAELANTDEICRHQLQPGEEGYDHFKRIFGGAFLQEDGEIDRTLLRHAVFNDNSVKDKLEQILHPLVEHQITVRKALCAAAGKTLVVEIPLLFEVGWNDFFDASVVVYVPESVCIQRVMNRDGMIADDVVKVMRTQMDISQKREYADFSIDNSGTFVSTFQQTAWLARKLRD